jgi:protein tyrosine/serine phosphatase
VINTLIGANPAIFEAALDKIDAQYGSFDGYLEECIGVTEQMKRTLRERYLK